MAAALREKYGEDGGKLVAVLEDYAFGKVKKCTHRDRLTAVEMLLERGWGKAAQVVAGDPENPVGLRVTFGGRHRPEAEA